MTSSKPVEWEILVEEKPEVKSEPQKEPVKEPVSA